MPITSKIAIATSLGTSTGKTLLNGGKILEVPAWARRILGFVPYGGLITPTADEGLLAKMILESEDLNCDPFQIIALAQGSIVITSGGALPQKRVIWVANIPCQGGNKLKIYGQCLRANSVAPYMGVEVIFGGINDYLPSHIDPLKRQRFAKVGTLTATVDGTADGTAYTISGGERIVGLQGAVGKDATVASKPMIGYIELVSSGFGAKPVQYAPLGAGAILGGVDSAKQLGVTLIDHVNIPITSPCTIQDHYTQEGGTAITTDDWITGVVFLKREVR